MVEGVIIFMKIITLFEHEQLILSDASPLRQSHFYHLEKINQQAGVELIHIGYKRIKAKSYVGVIQIGDVTIQILPKVDITGQDNSKSESSVKSAVSNLLWMLIYAGELPVKESEISPLTRMKGNLFEIFPGPIFWREGDTCFLKHIHIKNHCMRVGSQVYSP